MAAPLTTKGRATRQRIVGSAAKLMGTQGVAATSLDDVRAATKTSKSQLYHYFGDKQGLVLEVIDFQCRAVLDFQAGLLDQVESWRDMDDWADAVVDAFEASGRRGGCPIGTLAAELSDSDVKARKRLDDAFSQWHGHIRDALLRLREHGQLARQADADELATGLLGALEGGLLLAKASRDSEPLRASLRAALAHAKQRGKVTRA
jgi:TetR/AcrR family transcriptional repressor of nem operon